MKILTTLSLLVSMIVAPGLKEVAKPLMLVGSGANAMLDISYYYGVDYMDVQYSATSTSSTNYYCDLQVNIHGLYSGTVRINLSTPTFSDTPSTYKLNYVIYGCNATSTTVHNDYVNVRIPDGAQSFNIRFYFTESAAMYYGLSYSGSNSSTEVSWINQGFNGNTPYFAPLSMSNSLVALSGATEYVIDYTDLLEDSLLDGDGNGVVYYLDDIGIDTENIYAELQNIHDDMITAISTLRQSVVDLNSTVTKDRILNEWIAGSQASSNNTFDGYYYGYLNNDDGPAHPNTLRTWYLGSGSNFNNGARVNIPTYNSSNPRSGPTYNERQNLKAVIFFKNIDGVNNAYWLNVPFPYLSDTTYTTNLYLYSQKDNAIYRVEFALTLDYDYSTTGSIQITMTYLSFSNLSIYTLTETTYIDRVYITAEPVTQEQLMQKILDEIKDVSINVNVSNTEINNSVTEYNENIDYVYTIENNINTQLNTAIQGFVLPDNTTLIDSLSHSTTMFNSVLTRLNGISVISVPLTIALVGIILIAILG